jgi:uncharacterized protein
VKNLFIALLLILFCASLASAEVNFPKPTGFVNDYAGILSGADKSKLEEISMTLKAKTGAELAVAIVKTAEPLDTKTYAVKLFEKWKIGEKGKDNGILILLAMEEKRIEIEVGYGLEGVVPDAKAGEILDRYAVPYFKQGKYGEGLYQTALALSQRIAKEPGAEPHPPSVQMGEIRYDTLIILVIILLILGRVLPRKFISNVIGAVIGGIFGFFMAGMIGAVVGALLSFFLMLISPFWGGMWGGGMGGGFGGGGGGFGGGRSGGGGTGRSW